MVVLCFMRGTKAPGSGISALRLNQSTGFGKPASSFSHICKFYGGMFTYYARSRVRAKASLDRELWIGVFALHNFRGLCKQTPADRTQESSRQCDWLYLPPTSSVIKSHLPSLCFSPFSAGKCQANKGERSNGGEKKKQQSHVSTKGFLETQNKQLEEKCRQYCL